MVSYRTGSTIMSYSRIDCVLALKRTSERVDGKLSRSTYTENRPDWAPGATTVISEFGSWNEAKKSAGLNPLRDQDYSVDKCIEAIQAVFEKLNKSPSRSEYDEVRPNWAPSSTAIKSICGSWNQAKDMAGIHSIKREYTREECIEALQHISDLVDGTVTRENYREHKPNWAPSTGPIKTMFDSWNAAKKIAGLEVTAHELNLDEEDYIDALRFADRNCDDILTEKKYHDCRPKWGPSSSHIVQKFGDWNSAKNAADLETVGERYSKEDCISALKRINEQSPESVLSRAEYDSLREPDDPAGSGIEKKYETWNEAKQAADLNIHRTEFTKNECVKAIQHVSERLGKSPTSNEYDNNRPVWGPSVAAIESTWGGWNNAKTEAGIELHRHYYDEEDCVRAIRLAANSAEGEGLSKTQYRQNKPGWAPSTAPFQECFDSWTDAKMNAGVKVVEKEFSKEGCKRSIEHVRDVVGSSPGVEEYRKNKPEWGPSSGFIEKTFGSWNAAKKSVGLDVVHYERSEEECVTALKRVAEEIGKSPSRSQYERYRQDSEPSAFGVSSSFGTWNQAKRIADLTTYCDGINYPYGSDWDSSRRQVLERDDYECVSCGLTQDEHFSSEGEDLHIHHIHKLRSYYGTLSQAEIDLLDSDGRVAEELEEKVNQITQRANHLTNLVSVCRDCHLSGLEGRPIKEQLDILDVEEPKFSPEDGLNFSSV